MVLYTFAVEISKQEDGLYRASCPELQGCWVDGPTLEEVLRDIQEVIQLSVRSRIKHQEAWPAKKAHLPVRLLLPVELP